MILPTMNDEELLFEAVRTTHWLCGCFGDFKDEVIDKFRRGTRFPYFQRIRLRDDKGNEWWFTCLCPSKEYKKRMMFKTFAYTVYDVPPKRSENLTNAGKGALVFDPLAMKTYLETKERAPGSIVADITPHAMNRYTDRYLKPAGKEGLDVQQKMESIMQRWMHFDICADLTGDKNAKKHTGDGICPIDINTRGGGMFRGYVANNLLMRLTTYVSDDMLYDNQRERQDEMTREYNDWKRRGIYK